MDAGPDEVQVTGISKDGIFTCKEAHELQVARSYDDCEPTALQVTSPPVELIAAGITDGHIVYVSRTATRLALPGEAMNKGFKCQKSRTTHPIDPFLNTFECTVHSQPPATFFVMASEHDPTIPKSVAVASAAGAAVKLWAVKPNLKKPGFFNKDARKDVSGEVDVTFKDAGSGLPSSIVPGRFYRPTCITAASFELMPELVSLSAEWRCEEAPLLLRRGDTAQRGMRAYALKYHEKGESAIVKWGCIKAQRLSHDPNDFAKIFCSGSKDVVDVFETEANGELLFNMMTFCTEFWYCRNFLSADAYFDSNWSLRSTSFSSQPYWYNCTTSEVSVREPSTNLKKLSTQASFARNGLFHGEMELTISEFERTFSSFVVVLEEIVKVCNLLIESTAVDEMRSHFASTVTFVQQKLSDVRQRRLLNAAPTPQEQREAADLLKQFLMEKRKAEQLEKDKENLQKEKENLQKEKQSLQLHVEQQQEEIEGNRESMIASLSHIASFSKGGDQDIEVLSQRWASGSRQPLLQCIHHAAAGKHSPIVCVHGQHGCGKSSALSQVITQLRSAENTVVLSYLFKFGDAASSVDVALASLCIQLWQQALHEVSFPRRVCVCQFTESLMLHQDMDVAKTEFGFFWKRSHASKDEVLEELLSGKHKFDDILLRLLAEVSRRRSARCA